MITTNEQIFAAVYEYKLAKALAQKAFSTFGVYSGEYSAAINLLVVTESVIQRNGLQVEAGLKFANVWD